MATKASRAATHGEEVRSQTLPPRRRTREFRRNLPFLLMASPVMLWVLIFSYLPMGGLIIAFKDYRFDKGILGSDWVGPANFQFLLGSGVIGRIVVNTLFLNSLFIV